jgi:hypothetical protein
MSLTRRNVGKQPDTRRERRGSSIWEDEADEYWKKMEPAKRCRRITNCIGAFLLAVLLCGGVFVGARAVLDADSTAALKARFPTLAVTLENGTNNSANHPDAAPAGEPIEAVLPAPPVVTEPAAASADHELLRGRCRVRGVHSRWHEETCRKLCVRYVGGLTSL